ncbi:MAG: CheR family methyltransferase [Planctomycetota bacterium]
MSVAETTITPADFAFVVHLVHQQCGLVLESGKEYLVRTRLTPVAARLGLPNLQALLQQLREIPPRQTNRHPLVVATVEALVTTETSFFRDLHPFETLRKTVLPALIERRQAQRTLNIWCAASSSGQEPYSLAILLHEHFPELTTWQVNFLATDLSQEMLARAQTARYSQIEVNRGLPTNLLLKWFRQEGTSWQLQSPVRDAVRFLPLNLHQPWFAMPKWDLILMRNVMIYFDSLAKSSILKRLSRSLQPDGYLILGATETTLNLSDSFERIESLKTGFHQLRASHPPKTHATGLTS